MIQLLNKSMFSMNWNLPSIPKKIYDGVFPITIVLFFNMVLFSTCSYLGCYNINLTNIFRMNMLCNACTDMSYHLQVHQIKLYIFIGGYIIKRMNEVIDNQITNISPSKN